jgi:hypothetical protein
MENEPINRRLWEILRELGRLKSLDPADEEVERRRELLRRPARSSGRQSRHSVSATDYC